MIIWAIQENWTFLYRTYASFENKLKSGINLNPTDYILPNEVIVDIMLVFSSTSVLTNNNDFTNKMEITMKLILNQICAMINVVLDAKNQSLKLCSADGLDMVGVQHLSRCKSFSTYI